MFFLLILYGEVSYDLLQQKGTFGKSVRLFTHNEWCQAPFLLQPGSHVETQISLRYKDDRAVFWDVVLCILQVCCNWRR